MASRIEGTGRRYIVRRSKIHGRGVFALAQIPKGTRLMEYIGERISHREADRRYAAEHEHSPHTMLFSVDDKTVIDATRWGNSARFINHSEKPNVNAELLRIPSNSYDLTPSLLEIVYVANKTIQPGEQLLVCYEDEEKRASDDATLVAAEHRRRFSVEAGLRWRLHREQHYLRRRIASWSNSFR